MDREAEFRRLYEAHRAAVHAYFTGRTGDPQTAADLMQDVFLRVWQHLEKLTDDAGRPAAGVDLHRGPEPVGRRAPAPARPRPAPSRPWPMSRPARPRAAAPRPAARCIAAERVAVVGEAIRRLPEPQRVTLTMAAAGGMTSAELAAVLGVPAGTVRYRLSLARRTVAEALDRYDDPTET